MTADTLLLVFDHLTGVTAPTLFIVGRDDTQVLERNRDERTKLTCLNDLAVVEGAGHLFEGPDELETVADLAADWFERHLA